MSISETRWNVIVFGIYVISDAIAPEYNANKLIIAFIFLLHVNKTLMFEDLL